MVRTQPVLCLARVQVAPALTAANPELRWPQAAAELALGLDGRGRRSPHERSERLEQRRWSPLPVLAFLFRDIFYVVDVSAGLGQDVVQVVADADEGETLFEELADARCPEQEDAENGVVLAGVLDQLLRGRAEFGRGIHVRELVLVVKAHRHAKIVLSQEKDVNARYGSDLGNIFNAGSSLYLEGDDAFVVPVAGVAEQSGLVHAALRKINGAR